MKRQLNVPFFRIFYSSSYITLLLVLLALLCATPGDHIYQIITNDKLGNIFVLGGTYLLTALIAIFIYASRLYTNKVTIAQIPRPYLPIEEGEIGKNVRRLIVKNRHRSALIAWESHPRDTSQEHPGHETYDETKLTDIVISLPNKSPPWGAVEHPGWSSPAAKDIPSLQFETVVKEMANLIEAKAVSLAAPVDKGSTEKSTEDMATLQRSPSMGLRQYLEHLQVQGVDLPPNTGRFLQQYEHARFSGQDLSEERFRSLMDSFSTVLEEMYLNSDQSSNQAASENSASMSQRSDIDTHKPALVMQRQSSWEGSASIAESISSVIHHRSPPSRPP